MAEPRDGESRACAVSCHWIGHSVVSLTSFIILWFVFLTSYRSHISQHKISYRSDRSKLPNLVSSIKRKVGLRKGIYITDYSSDSINLLTRLSARMRASH